MRFLKQQSTNTRGAIASGIRYDVNNQAVVDGTQAIVVPLGTTSERPALPTNGQLRYIQQITNLKYMKILNGKIYDITNQIQ